MAAGKDDSMMRDLSKRMGQFGLGSRGEADIEKEIRKIPDPRVQEQMRKLLKKNLMTPDQVLSVEGQRKIAQHYDNRRKEETKSYGFDKSLDSMKLRICQLFGKAEGEKYIKKHLPKMTECRNGHPLQVSSRQTHWICNLCRVNYQLGAMERCRCDNCDYDLCGNCRADLLHKMAQMTDLTASGHAAVQQGATQMWKDHKNSRGRKVMRNSVDAVDVYRNDFVIVYDNNPTVPFPMKEEQERYFPKAKLNPMVGNAYYCKPEDLCICPPGPPCSYKGPNGTSDFKCRDPEGKRTCEPGKTRHDKLKKLVTKEFGIPESEIIAAAGIQEGRFNDKSRGINAVANKNMENPHIRKELRGNVDKHHKFF